MRKILTTSLLLTFASFSTLATAGECGKVTIADMNWNSATLIA
ncbi:MAG: glycine betaine/proline transport system substrate-binding protein, partial [Paraglaciecola sp.]